MPITPTLFCSEFWFVALSVCVHPLKNNSAQPAPVVWDQQIRTGSPHYLSTSEFSSHGILKGWRSSLCFLFSGPTVASSSAEHDLHSNWLLRVPRAVDSPGQDPLCAKGGAQKHKSGSTSSRLHLQRNPIHLPKAVHSAFQSLRSRPKLKK